MKSGFLEPLTKMKAWEKPRGEVGHKDTGMCHNGKPTDPEGSSRVRKKLCCGGEI